MTCEWDLQLKEIAYSSILNVVLLCPRSTLRLGSHMRNLYHFSVSTDRRPSAQKYSGTYNTAEANRATHSQMYSPARRSLENCGLIQHQYYTENVSSKKVVRNMENDLTGVGTS